MLSAGLKASDETTGPRVGKSLIPCGARALENDTVRASAAVLIAVAVAAAGCSNNRVGSHGMESASPFNSLAGEVDRELSAMRVTHYQHDTQVDEATGRYKYDCSGLLDYALHRVSPDAVRALPVSTSSRPLAADIERFLHRGLTGPLDYWQALRHISDLRPGDVIAWLATEDSKTGDTGHVMVVHAPPTRDRARRGEWLVEVVDSTLSPHAHDSRRDGDTGLGAGTIGLADDGSGAAEAFYWRGGVSPEAKPTEIAFGRPRGSR